MSIHNQNVEQVNEIILRNLRERIESIESKPRQLSIKDITIIGFHGFAFKPEPESVYHYHDLAFFTCFGKCYKFYYDQDEMAEKLKLMDKWELSLGDLQQEIIDNRDKWVEFENWDDEDFNYFKAASGLVTVTD